MADQRTAGNDRPWEMFGGVSNLQLGYFLLRFTLGVNIFFHGFMRIATGLSHWVDFQTQPFIPPKSPLPVWSVHLFLYTLPFIEVALGTLTALGLLTRWALLGGSVMMFVLVFGNDMRQDWGTVGNNMHYVLYYVLLIAGLKYNCFALDTRKSGAENPGRAPAASGAR